MEASGYVDATLDIYRNLLATHPNTGICLQAYLHRTAADVDAMLPMRPSIRLVKGAYAEPANVAMQSKNVVDVSYFTLAQKLLRAQIGGDVRRAAFATHDAVLIGKITDFAAAEKIAKNRVEVQMLYGIQRAEQVRLANGGWRSGVLVAYGDYWYPWFMRRLAERPANLWFVVRSLAGS
jgi:proline dehydrogenase